MANSDPFGDTVVAFIEIKMMRSGMMSIGGTITDKDSVLAMIDTARATLVDNFKRKGKDALIVPAYDTALVGTEYEKRLLKSVDDLNIACDKAN